MGILFTLISYFTVKIYKPNQEIMLIALENETQNVLEIIKSDFKFVDHLVEYYEDVSKIEQKTTSSYQYYYLYFDRYNQLTDSLNANYYVQIMMSKTSSNKYERRYYIIRKYLINENLKEVQIGETIDLQIAKKK